MNKFFLVAIALFLSACASSNKTAESAAPEGSKETFKMSRYIQITVCPKGAKCLGPVVKDLENANLNLAFDDFAKADVTGVQASDKYKVTDSGVTFSSEIVVTKTNNANEYRVRAMLRSGDSLKRKEVVKTLFVANPLGLKKTFLSDKTIPYKGGTLKAELVIDQPLNIENKSK